MILLDTNALLWATANSRRMGTKTKRRLDDALVDGQLAVPTIVFLEAAMLHWANRVDLGMSPDIWHRRHINLGLREIPLTGKIAVAAAALEPRSGSLLRRPLRGEGPWSHQTELSWPGP